MLPRPERVEDAVLVTHKSCLDGAGCALVFMRAGGRPENVRYVPAGMVERFVKEDPAFAGDRFLIFADVGINVPGYADRLEKRGSLVLLDHHKTSLHMRGRAWADVSMDACATEMLRGYLGPHLVGKDQVDCGTLSRVIDDHDRWLGRVPVATDLAMFMVFVGQREFVVRFSDGRDLPDEGSLFSPLEAEMVEVLRRRRNEAIASAVRHCLVRDVNVGGRSFRMAYVVSDEPNTSLLLHRLLDARADAQVACQVMTGHGKVSLRSRGDFDVTEVARQFGGGGHAAAAGHLIPQSVLDDFITELHSHG